MHKKILKHPYPNNLVSPIERSNRNKHNSGILYFTGFSGSLKPSLLLKLEKKLFNDGIQVAIINDAIVREDLCSDLQKTKNDSKENLRRAIELSLLMTNAGWIVLADFVSCGSIETNLFKRFPQHILHEVFLKLNAKARKDIFFDKLDHANQTLNQNIQLDNKRTKSDNTHVKKYFEIELSNQSQLLEEIGRYVCKEFLIK